MASRMLLESRTAGFSVTWVLACLLCMGCIGATPLPRRTHTPEGSNQNVQMDFLKVGVTRREEVREKLKPVDTGVRSERFFVGRWTSSTWGWIIWVDGGRQWATTNLLIEFDENGVAKRFEMVPDKDLSRALGPVAEERKRSDPAERVELSVWELNSKAQIILANDNLEFLETRWNEKPLHFTIAASKILSIRSTGSIQENPVYCLQEIRFTDALKPLGGPRGKRIFVWTTVPDLVTLLSYTHAKSGP